MNLIPLTHENLTQLPLPIRLIATDMDGTLTIADQFAPEVLASFQALAAAGIQVLIVTGRSAGWVSGLAHYLPIWGAIAENGGVFYSGQGGGSHWLVPISDVAGHRQKLAQVFQQLQQTVPHLQESVDNRFRLTDWTFDIQGLTPDRIAILQNQCFELGWSFTYSTVQCHIKLPQQDKATGLQWILQTYWPDLQPEQVLTVGDSPNDESLFNPQFFPNSVGVANLRHYCDRGETDGSSLLAHLPRFITSKPEGAGFLELATLAATPFLLTPDPP